MSATVQQTEQQRWQVEEGYWELHIRPSVEKLRSAQLREGSLYNNLRTFVPVLVLCVVWLWVIHWNSASNFHRLLGRSVTVRHLLLAFGVVALWNVWLGLSVYSKHSARRDVSAEVLRLVTAAFACSLLPFFGNITRGLFRQALLLGVLTGVGLLIASLCLLGIFFVGALLSPRLLRRRSAIIVGTGRRAAMLRARLQSHYSQFEFHGSIDDVYMGTDAEKDIYLGPISELENLLKTHPIEIVLIGLPMKSRYDDIQRVINICEAVGVESQYMQDIFETSQARVQVHLQDPQNFTVWSTANRDPKQHLKRAFDLIGASLLLAIFSPFMLAAAIAVRLSSPGPVLFVQQRYGRHRKRFPMFKFRSMVADAEAQQKKLEAINEAQGPVFKLKSDPRVTRVGAFLRKTSIDELPQLFNVLRGEMSLVGPRPLPLRDVSRFEETWLLRRFSVRPGLTCLWQVNGRSNTSFDYWIKQDLLYIDHWSLGLDLKILVQTIPAVLRGSGAV